MINPLSNEYTSTHENITLTLGSTNAHHSMTLRYLPATSMKVSESPLSSSPDTFEGLPWLDSYQTQRDFDL